MLRIAVVDDDFNTCIQIDSFMRQFSFPARYVLDDYSDGTELADALRNGIQYNIIFLDIEMRCYNGIKTSEIIRELDPSERIYIIYISAYTDKLISLFKFHPFDFLSKPFDYDSFRQIMDKISLDINKSGLRVSVPSGGDTMYIPVRDITYVESFGRKVLVHLYDAEPLECTCRLSAFLERLESISDNFCRIHKSFVINLLYVDSINGKRVMIGQTEILIGQTYRQNLLNKQYSRSLSGENEVN